MSSSIDRWNDEDVVRFYEAFTETHDRYQRANAALAENAAIAPDARVLDFAAGTGLTTEAVLGKLGSRGRVVAYEPADAMRRAGQRRVSDPRVTWTASLPARTSFDRIVCGAAIWQLDFDQAAGEIFERLEQDGAFVFNIPSLYLGVPDEPGGGRDPHLVALAAAIPHERVPQSALEPLTIARIEKTLTHTGFKAMPRWRSRIRLTQEGMRDWLKIPVINGAWIDSIDADARAALIDRLFDGVDGASWRWEDWTGWTAWRSGFVSGTSGV